MVLLNTEARGVFEAYAIIEIAIATAYLEVVEDDSRKVGVQNINAVVVVAEYCFSNHKGSRIA